MNIEEKIRALDDAALWSMFYQLKIVIGEPDKNPVFAIWYGVFKIVDDEANKRLAAEF